MATVVNNPPTSTSSDAGGGMGMVVGVVLVLVIVLLLLFFGLPALRGGDGGTETGGTGTEINVPEQIDLNVQGGGGAAPPVQ